MPTVLRDDQHEVTTEDGAVSLVFGTKDTGYLTLTPPVWGALGNGRTGDVERTREDGFALGEDFLGGDSVTFEVGVLTHTAADPHAAGRDLLAEMKRVWRLRRLRDRSSQYAILRQRIAGVTTRCYGRPREFEPSPGATTRKGYTPLVATFVVPDGRAYADTPSVQSLGLTVPTDGGFIAPFEFPLESVEADTGEEVITIGGSEDTWPIIRFHGPTSGAASRPEVDLGPFKVGLLRDVAAGDTVTVDPRPWKRTALSRNGSNYAGALTWETPPMRKMQLEPGSYNVSYTATDLTGTSWAEVEWRDAYSLI